MINDTKLHQWKKIEECWLLAKFSFFKIRNTDTGKYQLVKEKKRSRLLRIRKELTGKTRIYREAGRTVHNTGKRKKQFGFYSRLSRHLRRGTRLPRRKGWDIQGEMAAKPKAFVNCKKQHRVLLWGISSTLHTTAWEGIKHLPYC